MAINWTNKDDCIEIRISGVMVKPELDLFGSEIEPIIQNGKTKLLIILTDFGGWDDDSGDWSDLSFGRRNDEYIEKMAFVGDVKWKVSIEMFTLKGLRKFPIEFFPSGQEEFAKAWLNT